MTRRLVTVWLGEQSIHSVQALVGFLVALVAKQRAYL